MSSQKQENLELSIAAEKVDMEIAFQVESESLELTGEGDPIQIGAAIGMVIDHIIDKS